MKEMPKGSMSYGLCKRSRWLYQANRGIEIKMTSYIRMLIYFKE